MFPDSGVPPAEAKNSLPDVDSDNCDELWYSTSRCQPRFDPAAANAMLAEQMNLIMKGELKYDCLRLDHVERATRYIVQRGLPRYAILTGTADNLYGLLDPAATRINDGMTLSILPNLTNSGPVLLTVNGFGPHPVLRNDGEQLGAEDFRRNIPMEIIHHNGAWYVVGVVLSQVPEIRTGVVRGWVRTDGLDSPTHDGTENTPAKAFRTINYAYRTMGARYFPSPELVLDIRLGIPGNYEGFSIGPYGGSVWITGDAANRNAYIIEPNTGAYQYQCAQADAVSLYLDGINMVANRASQNWANLRVRLSALVGIFNCSFELRYPNLPGAYIVGEVGGAVGATYENNFYGNGNTISACIGMGGSAVFLGSNPLTQPSMLNFYNTGNSAGGLYAHDLGGIRLSAITVNQSGCVGPQYLVTDNSLIRAGGNTPPGNAAGLATENGLYFP